LKLLSIFFCKGAREIAGSKNQKSMQGVHFTMLPASPRPTEFYEIWHPRSTHRRNYICQIFSQLVQGLLSSDTPKIAVSY